MSGLPWFRFDAASPSHPKILRLLLLREGHRAGFVHWSAQAYCGLHGTDGHIEPYALAACHGRPADAARLVEVNLWHAEGHQCPRCPQPPAKGWVIHDWPDYQQSMRMTSDVQAAQQMGAAKGNCVRWHGPECGCWRKPGPDTGLRAVP